MTFSQTVASPDLNFSSLFAKVPAGAWVAISSDGHAVVSYGADMRIVLEEARGRGENDPILTRVPECATSLVL